MAKAIENHVVLPPEGSEIDHETLTRLSVMVCNVLKANEPKWKELSEHQQESPRFKKLEEHVAKVLGQKGFRVLAPDGASNVPSTQAEEKDPNVYISPSSDRFLRQRSGGDQVRSGGDQAFSPPDRGRSGAISQLHQRFPLTRQPKYPPLSPLSGK